VPETETQEDLPFERSSIAAIGRRRSWFASHFHFGNHSAPEGAHDEAPAPEDERITHSMLGSLAAAPEGTDNEAPAPEDERITHSMLGSLAAAPEGTDNGAPAPEDEPIVHSMLGSLAAEAGNEPLPDVEPEVASHSLLSLPSPTEAPVGPHAELDLTHLSLHSTLDELAGLEEHVTGSFPVERAILISLAAHLVLVLMLIFVPKPLPKGSKGDLLEAFYPEPKDDTPIPVFFQESPGPARENPKRSPLSDADRRAGGGDRSKPKSDTPFIPEAPGVAGLAPGPKAPRVRGSDVPPRKGATAEAERRPAPGGNAVASAEKSENAKPSEFPTEMRPQMGSGPTEMTKLAGLDQAIREAARGAVGGEGGAPRGNPEGGFVDSGPISFDTTWYDWGPYAAEMVRRIKLHWDVPELARLGWKGKLTVRFYILADGTVADAKIIRASSIPPFDHAAFQAIVTSSPFRPLPADLHSQREGVTVTFFYNLRPEEDAEARK
jgi:TonB family protein